MEFNDISSTVPDWLASSNITQEEETQKQTIKKEIQHDVMTGTLGSATSVKEECLSTPYNEEMKCHIKTEFVTGYYGDSCIENPENVTTNSFISYGCNHVKSEWEEQLNDGSSMYDTNSTLLTATSEVNQLSQFTCNMPHGLDKNLEKNQLVYANGLLLADKNVLSTEYTLPIENEHSQNTNQTEQQRMKNVLKKFKCKSCQKAFTKTNDLKRHELTHTEEKPYRCDICNKTFTRRFHLIVHLRIHSNLKPYKCEMCDKEFTASGDLRHHVKTHTKEKPYQCEICKKSFSLKGNLIVHQRIHNDEKPYQCEMCEKAFTQKGGLINHQRIHNNIKLYKCDRCEMSFTQNAHLKSHQSVHTKEKSYQCEICKKSFTRQYTLNVHQRIHNDGNLHQS